MKIAMPLFGTRISPRFDVSPEMWIVEVENGQRIHQEKLPITHLSLPQRLDHLTSSGVTQVICGGIDHYCTHQLMSRGIDVVPNVAGEAEEAFSLFLRGALRPGYCCDTRRGKGCARWRKRYGGRSH